MACHNSYKQSVLYNYNITPVTYDLCRGIHIEHAYEEYHTCDTTPHTHTHTHTYTHTHTHWIEPINSKHTLTQYNHNS